MYISGPDSDHNGDPNGYYLYMEVSSRQGGEKARILVTPRFQGQQCSVSIRFVLCLILGFLKRQVAHLFFSFSSFFADELNLSYF